MARVDRTLTEPISQWTKDFVDNNSGLPYHAAMKYLKKFYGASKPDCTIPEELISIVVWKGIHRFDRKWSPTRVSKKTGKPVRPATFLYCCIRSTAWDETAKWSKNENRFVSNIGHTQTGNEYNDLGAGLTILNAKPDKFNPVDTYIEKDHHNAVAKGLWSFVKRTVHAAAIPKLRDQFHKGLTTAELRVKYNLTRSRIHQIREGAIKKLKRYAKKEGLTLQSMLKEN